MSTLWSLLSAVLVAVFAGQLAAGLDKHGGARETSFAIEDVVIGGELQAKALVNTVTGEYAEVVVDYGGRVEALELRSQSSGKVWPVLLTHGNNATAIKENAWWKGMLLIPWANRIAYGQYTFFNGTYQLPLNEDTPTMQNALHGLLAGVVMQVQSTTVDKNGATLVLAHKTDGLDQGYPFLLSLEVQYTLREDGFSVAFRITNLMPRLPLPVYVGWHPYFKCTAYSAFVVLDQCTQWNHVQLNTNLDPTGITDRFYGLNGTDPIGGSPTEPTLYDDEYKPRDGTVHNCDLIQTKICDMATGHNVVLWQDDSFRFVHIFTGYTSPFHESAIAVEPMSAMADSYNNHDHLTVLSGGETWTGSFGVYVE